MITAIEDLQNLIGIQESKTLDFKLLLKFKSREDDEEFLKDICSFANTVGGQIIYGIKEENLIATEIVGMRIDNIDSFLSTIENKAKTIVQPRIPGFNVRAIQLPNSNYVIVINIPKSWLGPHGFLINKGWRFYLRGSAQSSPLDINQLRDLFIQSDQLTQNIRKFRDLRISDILSDSTGVHFNPLLKSKLVMHIIPMIAFNASYSIDFNIVEQMRNKLKPIFGSGSYQRYNFDGFITYDKDLNDEGVTNYFQFFRNGIIETVNSGVMNRTNHDGKEIFFLSAIDTGITEYLQDCFSLFEELNIESPIVFFYSLLNVKGKYGEVSKKYWFANLRPIDRDHVLFPETIINSTKDKIDDMAEQIFLPMWHSFDFKKRMI